MEKRTKEVLALIVLPAGLSVYAAIEAVQNASTVGSVGWIVTVAGGLTGIALVLLLIRLSPTETPGAPTRSQQLPRWFTPLLLVSIGAVSFSSQMGPALQAGIFMVGSAFLATFATVALIKLRRLN
jgi:hypothetical protein